MNHIPKTILLIAIVSTFCLRTEVIIRPATLADLDAITALSHHEYHNTFKPMWLEKYAPTVHLEQSIDDFINEKITANRNANKEFIIKQSHHEEYGFLIATIIEENTSEKIVGYCRFQRESMQAMYINFILVDETVRKQGIGKKLLLAAIKTYEGITECNFRSLIHNDFINDLYKQHGCIIKETVALEPNTGLVSTNPNILPTHFDWTFPINK